MNGQFTLIDFSILFVYLIVLLSMAFYYSSRETKDMAGYFLAGRKMGWITVGLSIFATNISSEHFIGLAGSGATRGLAVGQFELLAVFILILLGRFVAPVFIRSGIMSTPEFLEERFDRRSRKLFSLISIIVYIVTKISVSLLAGGFLFQKMFGLNIYTSAIILVLITGIYSVIGGSYTIMKTHVLQAVLLLLGAVILTVFGLYHVGGFTGLYQKLDPQYFHIIKPAGDPDFPWTGMLFGAPILAFWYWCTDQYIVQRLLSARSIADARKGSIFASLLKITPIFILVLPGLIAVALFPEIRGDEAYPTLIASNILPAGIKGLVVVGLLSAIMSSLASVFNVSAALFTNDYYKLNHPDVSDVKLVLVGRLMTMGMVIVAILCIPIIKIINSQVYLSLQNLQGLFAPPITVVFLFGLMNKKVNARGAFWTLLLGEILGSAKLLFDNYFADASPASLVGSIVNINFLHFSIFSFAICTIMIFAISKMFPVPMTVAKLNEIPGEAEIKATAAGKYPF